MGVFHKHNQTCSVAESHKRMHKFFLISNYILLSAASSCIFLTLSLRLFPSLCGFFFILLQTFTIIGAISGCSVATSDTSSKLYAVHMVTTSLIAIFQGSVSVLIFTQTGEFLGYLNSYVRQEDGELILKLAGGLCVLIFGFLWVVLSLAFLLRYYSFIENGTTCNGVVTSTTNGGIYEQDELKKNWPMHLQNV